VAWPDDSRSSGHVAGKPGLLLHERQEPQRARAQFRALATGGSGWLPDEGRLWRVETGWRLDDGDWMMISAEWTPVLGNP